MIIIIAGFAAIFIAATIKFNIDKKKAGEHFEETTACERCFAEFTEETGKHLHSNGKVYCTKCRDVIKPNAPTWIAGKIK